MIIGRVKENDEAESETVDETGVDIAEALDLVQLGQNSENKDFSEKEITVLETVETELAEEGAEIVLDYKYSRQQLISETLHSPTVGDLAKVTNILVCLAQLS